MFRKLKWLLVYANAITVVEGLDMTIKKALVYLAQLKERVRRYSFLIVFQESTRKTVEIDGKIEYTKIIFDQKDAKTEVIQLQTAIDRINLTSYFDC